MAMTNGHATIAKSIYSTRMLDRLYPPPACSSARRAAARASAFRACFSSCARRRCVRTCQVNSITISSNSGHAVSQSVRAFLRACSIASAESRVYISGTTHASSDTAAAASALASTVFVSACVPPIARAISQRSSSSASSLTSRSRSAASACASRGNGHFGRRGIGYLGRASRPYRSLHWALSSPAARP